MVQVTQSISPAHDLVGEQHSAHFRVLVLPLIDDGLGEGEVRRVEGKEVPLKSRWWHRGGPVGLHWHLPSPGRGEALLPEKIMPSTLLWGSPGVQSRSLAAQVEENPLPSNQDHHQGGKNGMRFAECLSA
jgi:hypothetical protein